MLTFAQFHPHCSYQISLETDSILIYIPDPYTTHLESQISDQFAFRPTGSTSVAVISIIYHTKHLLKTNKYMYASIISLDFCKAFDTVKHSYFFDKISTLDIPN